MNYFGRKIGLLASLYFAQGLPFGFFTQALPVLMRQEGMSLAVIGYSSLLALPWGLKWLWAPLVDRTGSRLGRRRGWIIPLQLLAVAVITALAVLPSLLPGMGQEGALGLMAGAVLLTNLLAATQDVATDGLAVDLLDESERGHGNGVQVAAYRIGMVVGSSALMVCYEELGWMTTFLSMSALLLLSTLPIVRAQEPSPPPTVDQVSYLAAWQFIHRPQVALWLALAALYKLGDALGSPMIRPMLVDAGWSPSQIGVVVGSGGSVAGLIGALLGGVMASRGRLSALTVAGLAHAVLMAAWAWPASLGLVAYDDGMVLLFFCLISVEHITGGMATVALFTAMMDACDRRTGATDYTTQASLVVFVTGLGSGVSGVSAEGFGYSGHFLFAGGLCAVGTLALIPFFKEGSMPPRPPTPPPIAGVASRTSAALPAGAPTR